MFCVYRTIEIRRYRHLAGSTKKRTLKGDFLRVELGRNLIRSSQHRYGVVRELELSLLVTLR